MAVIMDESWADDPGNFTLSNGDLTVNLDVAPWRGIIATTGWSSGKYYWEVTINSMNNTNNYSVSAGICLTTHTKTSFMGSIGGFGCASHDGNNQTDLFRDSTANDPLGPFAEYFVNDVLGFAFDMDNNKLFVHLNGIYYNSGDPVGGTGAIYSSIPAGTWYPAVSLIVQNSKVTYNFGAVGPSYSIPTGYTMPDYTPPLPTYNILLGKVTLKNLTLGKEGEEDGGNGGCGGG